MKSMSVKMGVNEAIKQVIKNGRRVGYFYRNDECGSLSGYIHTDLSQSLLVECSDGHFYTEETQRF
jgi:hypothetical protein